MPMLPPYVIERERAAPNAPVQYLGPCGWVKQRRGALSFDTEGQAADWLAVAKKDTPRLVAGTHRVSEVPIDDDAAVGRAIASEYEPYEAR